MCVYWAKSVFKKPCVFIEKKFLVKKLKRAIKNTSKTSKHKLTKMNENKQHNTIDAFSKKKA